MTRDFLKLELYPESNGFWFPRLDAIVGIRQRAGYVEVQMSGGHKENVNAALANQVFRMVETAYQDHPVLEEPR